MKAENKYKRVLQVELDNNVKKVAITGVMLMIKWL